MFYHRYRNTPAPFKLEMAMRSARFSPKNLYSLATGWLLIACCSVSAYAQPRDLSEASTISLNEGVGHVLRGEVSNPVATRIVFRVGESGDGAYRDELRSMVERYTGSQKRRGVLAMAVYALSELGEDDAYFRDLALRWREDEWRARVAMNMLALSPTPENLTVVERVASEATSGLLTSALSTTQVSREQIERYQKLQGPQEKVDYALLYAIRGWRGSSSGYVGVGIQQGLHPWSINGRCWLRELSEQYPDLVARTLATYTTDSERVNERIESLRDFLAHFISDEARATLQRLRAAQPEDR